MCKRGKVHGGFWLGILRGSHHLEDLGVDGTILLKWKFKKFDMGVNSTDVSGQEQVYRCI